MPDIFLRKVNRTIDQYTVHYKGLKIGRHHFDFEVDDSFFEQFDEGEIKKGKINVSVELERHNLMLEFRFNIKGLVEVECDRCLDPFMLPISFKGDLFVKITENENVNDDEIWFISNNEHQVNLAQYIYESINLSLPLKRYHGISGTNESDCDPIMLNRLKLTKNNTINNSSSNGIDPRWEKLKDLQIDNNNTN